MREKALSATRESKSIDFKRSFDLDAPGDWCEVLKDVVAMANSGGGAILFGVENDGATRGDASVARILALDPAAVTDKINKYTGVQFDDFTIDAGLRDGTPVAVILVGAAAIPLVFSKPGTWRVRG